MLPFLNQLPQDSHSQNDIVMTRMMVKVDSVVFIVRLALVMIIRVSCASSPPPPPPLSQNSPQPHIVLIVADDLGWHDVSWHNPTVLTPHLESLGKGPGGVLLEQSYVQPICTPTRAALLSGRYPYTLGRQHKVVWPFEPTGLTLDATLLPQVMKEAGYSTHAVGKWHLGFCSWDYTPTRRGFDTFYGYYLGAEHYYTHVHYPSRQGYDTNTQDCTQTGSRTKTEADRMRKTDGAEVKCGYDFRNNTDPDLSADGTYSTYLFSSYVERLLSSRSPKDPMFLYLPLQSVHSPLMVPSNYTLLYQHITHHARRTKLGMVTAMDEAIGKVVSALKDTGHYNNTIIIFTSDNGGPVDNAGNNWPLRGSKGSLWEGGTRGVALVHSPLLPNTPRVSNQLIHVTDWLPTLAGLVGGAVPPRTDGVDQWRTLLGLEPDSRTSFIYNIDNTTEFKGGIRRGDYKLLVGYPGAGLWTPPPENIDIEKTWNAREIVAGERGLESREGEQDSNTERKKTGDGIDDGDGDGRLRNTEEPTAEDEEIQQMTRFLGVDATKIKLYNLAGDPEERQNLASSHKTQVKELLKVLVSEMTRYVSADLPNDDLAGHPRNYGNIWTPGWCHPNH